MISFSRRAYLLLLCLVALCCKDSDKGPDNSGNYLLKEVGDYSIYDVKQELYSAGQEKPAVTAWQEKDQVASVTQEGENTTLYLISRYTRKSETDYWTKSSEYRIKQLPDKILTDKDNETFFSLVFPTDLRAKWNGNTYNSRGEEEYYYEALNAKEDISGKTFDNSLTVIERADSSIINKYNGIKIYALNVGLIYDDQISYEYCQTSECLESDVRKIESGYHVTRTIRETGSVLGK